MKCRLTDRPSLRFAIVLPLVALTSSFVAAAPPVLTLRAIPAASDEAVHPRLGIVAGRKLWKNITIEHHLVLMSREFVQNGVSQLSQQEMELATKLELAVQDHYRAVDAARPTLLWRSYDRVRQSAVLAFSDQPKGRLDGKSPLEGVSIVYTWVPEENGYGLYCDAAEAPELYLSGLSQDLDLTALLPERAVKPGETWEIQPDALKDVIGVGGNLPMKFGESPHATFGRTMMGGVGGGLHNLFSVPMQGRITARLDSVRSTATSGDSPGRDLAVITLTMKLDTDIDQTKRTQRSVRADEFHRGMSVAKASLRWSFEGTGELIWDLKEGRVESFALQGKEDVHDELSFASASDDENRQALYLAGSMKLRFEVLTSPPAQVADGASEVNGVEVDEELDGTAGEFDDDEK